MAFTPPPPLLGHQRVKVEISNQHLTIDPRTKLQFNRSKILNRTENGSIFMFIADKFEYDALLTSQLVISSSILLFRVDFIHS